MFRPIHCVLFVVALVTSTGVAPAAEFDLNGKHFTLADGLTIELAAAAPLTERPICVDFDEQGRLYVAESSGTNDNVQKQLADKPHSILRLEDSDGDGVYDKRTVFADRLMFPEGCEWHDGSLYVGAPPQIWKLTDTNDDGVADQREVWFDGQTLTGCANDLHGPYTGPDGLLYWCKGAFAEQTHEQPDAAPFVTKASHIFRHDPRGGFVEPILTGGMDNPVEVAWTRDGEPILTCTFLQRPAKGQRDGLIHAVYGGVWGKDHGVLDGHPRTGELLPPLAHLGAAAPCGLMRVEGSESAAKLPLNSQPSTLDSPDILLACSFNMHKVTRHVLRPAGATYATTDDDLIVCDDGDFHPTDIIEDADGSLLLVDTGGWYKLCCPTSQLHKPDVAGAIYRIRRTDQTRRSDPRGLKLSWDVSTDELASRLQDGRFEVRRRTTTELAKRPEAVLAMTDVLAKSEFPIARYAALWVLTQTDQKDARTAIRNHLTDGDAIASRIAIRSAGLWRDAAAVEALRPLLHSQDAHMVRVAAEALGRIGDRSAVADLLTAAGRAERDRFLHHAVTYALIQIADVQQTRAGLAANESGAVQAAMLALDAMDEGDLAAEEVIARLDQPAVRDAAMFILERHPEWDAVVAGALAAGVAQAELNEQERSELLQLATRFARRPAVSELLAQTARQAQSAPARRIALQAMAATEMKRLPAHWTDALIAALDGADRENASLAVIAGTTAEKTDGDAEGLSLALSRVASAGEYDASTRLRALRSASENRPVPSDAFDFLLARLNPATSVSDRLLAVDVLATAALTDDQFRQLAGLAANLGPMELDRLLPVFAKTSDAETGQRLAKSLLEGDAIESLVPEKLRLAFSKFDADVAKAARPLLERPQADAEERAAKLEQLLGGVSEGDPRRGQAVFQSSKAVCSSCHAIGFLGGTIGPDLTRIGQIRNERDLLEAILYPSASFVRSYEPMVVVTKAGQVHSGVPRDEDGDTVTLATAADRTVTLARDEIEEMRPGAVSIMPAGLDKQLTAQELADLVAFLKNAK